MKDGRIGWTNRGAHRIAELGAARARVSQGFGGVWTVAVEKDGVNCAAFTGFARLPQAKAAAEDALRAIQG